MAELALDHWPGQKLDIVNGQNIDGRQSLFVIDGRTRLQRDHEIAHELLGRQIERSLAGLMQFSGCRLAKVGFAEANPATHEQNFAAKHRAFTGQFTGGTKSKLVAFANRKSVESVTWVERSADRAFFTGCLARVPPLTLRVGAGLEERKLALPAEPPSDWTLLLVSAPWDEAFNPSPEWFVLAGLPRAAWVSAVDPNLAIRRAPFVRT